MWCPLQWTPGLKVLRCCQFAVDRLSPRRRCRCVFFPVQPKCFWPIIKLLNKINNKKWIQQLSAQKKATRMSCNVSEIVTWGTPTNSAKGLARIHDVIFHCRVVVKPPAPWQIIQKVASLLSSSIYTDSTWYVWIMYAPYTYSFAVRLWVFHKSQTFGTISYCIFAGTW